MNFRYDKEDDVMMIWFSRKRVDFVEQSKNIIKTTESLNRYIESVRRNFI